jgi:hypothetical protein
MRPGSEEFPNLAGQFGVVDEARHCGLLENEFDFGLQ